MKDFLTIKETSEMMLLVSKRIIEEEPLLTKIDLFLGDGDHGVGMKRGFLACENLLSSNVTFETQNELFKEVGLSLLKSMGGASGVLFSTFFTGGLLDIESDKILTTEFLNKIFSKSFEVMKRRGRSQEGKKTLLDPIGYAVRALEKANKDGLKLGETVGAMAEAAYAGCMATKEMIAGHGRARKLGVNSLGYPDPGAVSAYVIFAAMDEYMNGNPRKEIVVNI